MPRSTELQFRPPRRRQPGNSLPGGNESDGLRAFDAPALKRRTAEGAEAPYSGAPAVREYGAVLPTNFLGLYPPAPKRDVNGGLTPFRERMCPVSVSLRSMGGHRGAYLRPVRPMGPMGPMGPDGHQNDGISLHFRGVALVSLVTLVALVARIPAPVFGLQFLGRCPRLVWCRAVGAESIRISSLCACVSVFPAADHTVTQSQGHTVISSWRLAHGGGRWRAFPEGT